MAKPTYGPVDLNAVITAHTQEYLSRKLENQSFTVHPILDDLRASKKVYNGGVNVVVPILDGYTPVGGAFTRGSTIDLTHVDHATQARYAPVYYYEPVVLDFTDEAQAGGAGAMFDYVESAVDAGLMRIQEKVVTDLCAASTATNGIGSLLAYIDSTGAIGGLNPATAGQTFWAAHENSSVGSFGTLGAAALRNALLAVGKYKMLGRPTKIYCSTTAYQEYQKSGLSLSVVQWPNSSGSGRTTDIGTGTLNYEGIPVVYEPHLDALEGSLNGVMLGINTRGIGLAEKAQAFSVDPWRDLLPGGRMARATTLKWCGNTWMGARSCNFKLAGITA